VESKSFLHLVLFLNLKTKGFTAQQKKRERERER
jgi:hypothetical protein